MTGDKFRLNKKKIKKHIRTPKLENASTKLKKTQSNIFRGEEQITNEIQDFLTGKACIHFQHPWQSNAIS